MKIKIPLRTGDEQDALTKAKRYYYWRAGQRKKMKKVHNKKIRKYGREVMRRFAKA